MSAYDLTEDEDLAWMLEAPCRGTDPDVFFPTDPRDPVQYLPAVAVCSGCEHRERCLEYAIVNQIDTGVWGGLTEKERRKILKRRRMKGASL